MTLDPLLAATPAIQVHAFAAMGAFALGLVQLAGPKGTGVHRAIGWTWVVLMLVIAVSSFWIHTIQVLGRWSPIHLLSIFTLVTLPMAVAAARQGRVASHRRAMLLLFGGALLIAGAFTFVPGRIMHGVVTGG